MLTPVGLRSGCFLYMGDTTMTRWPRAASAGGSDPHTSPSPPVLDQGAACTALNMKQQSSQQKESWQVKRLRKCVYTCECDCSVSEK